MNSADEVLVRIEPPLAWLIINRPAAHNALNSRVWRSLAERTEALAERRDVRAVVLTGAGDEAFVSGADITEFQALRADSRAARAYDELAARTWTALARAPQPVVAMINGLCYGGGVALACACDLRLAADHARFAVPATRLGLSYPMEGGVDRLVQIVGPTHAAHLLLSALPIDAAEALRIGLVNQVRTRADLETATREYAQALADGAPLTLAAHKLAIRESAKPPGARDRAALGLAMQRCFDSADYQEGIRAFLEKRKPRFQGS